MKKRDLVVNHRKKIRRWMVSLTWLGWLLVGLAGPSTPCAFAEELRVILNKSNPVDTLSFHDLVKIFKGEKQFWPNGEKVLLLMREPGSAEKETILRAIYKMSEEKQKQFWLEKVFRGEAASLPKILNSSTTMRKVVASTPNAIGYVLAGEADGTVKSVKIDGAEVLK